MHIQRDREGERKMLSDRQNKIEAKEKEEEEEQEQSEKSNQKISSSIYLNDMLPQTIEKRATEANVVKPKIIRRKMCVYTHKHTKYAYGRSAMPLNHRI